MSCERKTLEHVLVEEVKLLRGAFEIPGCPRDAKSPASVAEVYRGIAALPAEAPLSALCLSGGGIRSATFNLGVLQALARAGILGSFDYLSTVSGGGYIGAWLQAWTRRERDEKPDEAACSSDEARTRVLNALAATAGPDPLRPEPAPIDRLREFSNYLTPRTGLLSVDTWTVVAIVLRNLLLNWLVIVPVLAFVVMIPQGAFVLSSAWDLGRPTWSQPVSWAALVLGLASSVLTHRKRAEPRGVEPNQDPEKRWKQRRVEKAWNRAFTVSSLGLLSLAATLFVLAALWAVYPWHVVPGLGAPATSDQMFPERMLRASIWTVGLPLLGAIAGTWPTRPWRRPSIAAAELAAFLLSGLLGAALLAWLTGDPWKALVERPALLTVLGVPALLVIYVLARAVFAGVRSVADDFGLADPAYGEADREWWARITGRALMGAAIWAGGSALVLLGVWTLAHGDETVEQLRRWIGAGIAALGGVSAIASALLGKSSDTSSGRSASAAASHGKELLLRVAAAVTVCSVVVVLSLGTAWLGRKVTKDDCFLSVGPSTLCAPVLARAGGPILPSAPARSLEGGWGEVGTFFLMGGALLLLSTLAGVFVNVNRFSLHGMYRDRLARAYLGASNTDRCPNAFSGFDPEDDALRLSDLRPTLGERARLLPIVNATLNVVRGERLAWQERQAESFSMTPLFCGNFFQGYRDSLVYGRKLVEAADGKRKGGIALGTAMAVSGAAANPNMGYVSTPALTFLMGLLNARLGVWMPNPGDPGDPVISRPSPRHASWHLVRELLGLTDDYSAFVNLSDGGHFDNLGLYEVVLRRCRLVVVSDAGCDLGHGFADLGNVIRKIRVDFGIPIEFEAEIVIPARGKDGAARPGVLCAYGTIKYSAADGATVPDGRLVYLKPALAQRPATTVPYDVQAYANVCAAFPHESTVDQWFSESQFESYRALGDHVVRTLLGERQVASWDDLVTRVQAHLARHDVEQQPTGLALQAVRAGGGVPLTRPSE